MPAWLDRLLTWDEHNDGTQPALRDPRKKAPPESLTMSDRELLDAIADGTWVHEDTLREKLKWSRWKFFTTTLRMTSVEWILARPAGSSILSKSYYRLNPEAWNNG